MVIGVKVIGHRLKWSLYNSKFWTDYVSNLDDMRNPSRGKSDYQDYTPLMPYTMYKWGTDQRLTWKY